MISREILYAILQGLPVQYLEHLDVSWRVFARRIAKARREGHGPTAALRIAFNEAEYHELRKFKQAAQHIIPVMQISGLSYRQRETLIVLREAGTASLAQLCRVLAQDRSNTYRRLNALVRKGYAVKFFQPGGVYYHAVSSPMQKSIKVAVNQLLDELVAEANALDIDMSPPQYL